jgi:hypothetical protein
MSRSAARTPSATTGKRSANRAALNTSRAFRDDDTTAAGMPRVSRWSSNRTEPGYGSMPCVWSRSWNIAFFRFPRAEIEPVPGGSS